MAYGHVDSSALYPSTLLGIALCRRFDTLRAVCRFTYVYVSGVLIENCEVVINISVIYPALSAHAMCPPDVAFEAVKELWLASSCSKIRINTKHKAIELEDTERGS